MRGAFFCRRSAAPHQQRQHRSARHPRRRPARRRGAEFSAICRAFDDPERSPRRSFDDRMRALEQLGQRQIGRHQRAIAQQQPDAQLVAALDNGGRINRRDRDAGRRDHLPPPRSSRRPTRVPRADERCVPEPRTSALLQRAVRARPCASASSRACTMREGPRSANAFGCRPGRPQSPEPPPRCRRPWARAAIWPRPRRSAPALPPVLRRATACSARRLSRNVLVSRPSRGPRSLAWSPRGAPRRTPAPCANQPALSGRAGRLGVALDPTRAIVVATGTRVWIVVDIGRHRRGLIGNTKVRSGAGARIPRAFANRSGRGAVRLPHAHRSSGAAPACRSFPDAAFFVIISRTRPSSAHRISDGLRAR